MGKRIRTNRGHFFVLQRKEPDLLATQEGGTQLLKDGDQENGAIQPLLIQVARNQNTSADSVGKRELEAKGHRRMGI
jgi:hypothetical protein